MIAEAADPTIDDGVADTTDVPADPTGQGPRPTAEASDDLSAPPVPPPVAEPPPPEAPTVVPEAIAASEPIEVEAAPVEAAPVDAAPVEVEAAPVEAAPVEAAPVEAAPLAATAEGPAVAEADPSLSPRRNLRTVVILTVLSLVVVGVGVGAVIWSRSGTNKAASPPPVTTAVTSPTLPDDSFVTFKDSEAGFSIRYPRGWTRSQPPVAEIRLWATDSKQFGVFVRVIRTEQVTTPANLANLKAVTDGVVGPGVQILKQDPITVNGLIGYRYIYTLTDKDSGLTTAHLHYFLFQGHKMNSIVFEALPSETFPRIEGIFDQMLGSFHSDPEPPS